MTQKAPGVDKLAAMAYNKYCDSIRSTADGEYFKNEQRVYFDELSPALQAAWKSVVRKILDALDIAVIA